MITKPTDERIIETVRAELREIVMGEVSSDRARSALRLADQLLADCTSRHRSSAPPSDGR